MEFNAAAQQYRATEPFPLFDQRSQEANSIIYSGGTLPAQTQTTQSFGVAPAQALNGWPHGNTMQNLPLQRHSTMFLEARNPRTEVPVSRPLSMTATTSFGRPGLPNVQNPRGEYLPQPNMPPPTVQPTKIAQAPAVQNTWVQPKLCGDLDFPHLETDISDYTNGMISADDDTTIIDLRKFTNGGQDHAQDISLDSSRRMSESTWSMSSNGLLTDVPSFDDLPPSTAHSQQGSDWPSYDVSKSQLDPSASPRAPQRDSLIRSSSRSRASPVPNLRASPYSLESTRNKRWSTGMYPAQPAPRPYQFNRYSSYFGSPLNPQNAFSSFGPEAMASFQNQQFLSPQAQFGGNPSMLFSGGDQVLDAPRTLPSQGLFRLLSSNADRLTGCYSHCADLSDPPDLYSSLNEEPSNPPEEDMNPSDPDLVPHEQELRFPGDLYTPKWVRGHGNKREGWCGLCKPGRWLVLKNSAFWYDKSFTHGVSAATGAAFQGPQETRRTEGNLDVWEGLCGSCGDWIALVSSKKKGTTWFRHAYKCHTHPKVKDGPKRRREAPSQASRHSITTASDEPMVTVTSDDMSTSHATERPMKEPRITEIDYDAGKNDNQLDRIKTEDESTPISTPQLSHTSTSTTPSLSSMHTPGSNYQQPTPNERKRFSMVFDTSMFSQGFSTSLETFAENESEQTPVQETVIPSTETSPHSQHRNSLPQQESTFGFPNDNGAFTQAEPFNYSQFSTSVAGDNDHFMTHSDNTDHDFFSQHSHFDFSASTPVTAQHRPQGFGHTPTASMDGGFPNMI